MSRTKVDAEEESGELAGCEKSAQSSSTAEPSRAHK